jgi:chorismate synthase
LPADRNTDQRSKDYGDILQTFRPGHADYAYWHKVRHPRPAWRRPLQSARLTAPMVAAGAVAKKWLAQSNTARCSGLHDANWRRADWL